MPVVNILFSFLNWQFLSERLTAQFDRSCCSNTRIIQVHEQLDLQLSKTHDLLKQEVLIILTKGMITLL